MKTRLIFILFLSLSLSTLRGQKVDTLQTVERYRPNSLIGVDLLHLGMLPFSDQKLISFSADTELRPRLHILAEAGLGSDKYLQHGYDVEANGIFAKAGVLYMLSYDAQNRQNGFYGSGKLAASFYTQDLNAVPIRGYHGEDLYATFPSSSQSSYWVEAAVGGRIRLFDSSFYIDAQVMPRYLLYTTKQENIRPMVIPGFGKSANNFTVGFSWSVAFRF